MKGLRLLLRYECMCSAQPVSVLFQFGVCQREHSEPAGDESGALRPEAGAEDRGWGDSGKGGEHCCDGPPTPFLCQIPGRGFQGGIGACIEQFAGDSGTPEGIEKPVGHRAATRHRFRVFGPEPQALCHRVVTQPPCLEQREVFCHLVRRRVLGMEDQPDTGQFHDQSLSNATHRNIRILSAGSARFSDSELSFGDAVEHLQNHSIGEVGGYLRLIVGRRHFHHVGSQYRKLT